MDLGKLDSAKGGEAGALMTLRHPDPAKNGEPVRFDPVGDEKEGKPMTIMIAGYDSPKWREASRRQMDERMARSRKQPETKEEQENHNIDLLVMATLDWEIQVDGQRPKCTAENARALYKRFIWIREQADNFANNRGNFIEA